ncbi:cation-translocating P-type ATPase [Iamia majanohamensis]|uniref:Cation-translocating P-type ATPase n=1 Tax=Iamia majanohamensis TaxID=467976 RepID=A0AAE9Y901_9ACTN|nr:cation-translocating P-type ATPase [Iamia majanohamensis]WCO67981.1 cation-translocating P-type ATPase [Iamia majanohamensis]
MSSDGGDDTLDRDDEVEVEHLWESPEVRWSVLAGALLAVGFAAGRFDVSAGVVTAVYVMATLAGLRFFAIEAMRELWRERAVGIELLMTVGTVAAAGLGEWGEAATLAFLYSISEALEEFTEDRTRNAIRALMDLAPKHVTRVRDGVEEEVAVADLAVGDEFLVRPGESIGTDGTIIDGRSALNEAAVTGESVPIEKQIGDQVFAGTLNTTGAVVLSATATADDNTLARIVHLVSEAQEQKGRGQQFMSRFARVYSPAVLFVGVLVAVAGGAATSDWSEWVARAATVIVAAAPCALVISIPVSYVAAIGNASRKGILIKGGMHLEELAQLDTLAMDKTGTITQGQPRVVEVVPADGHTDSSVLLAAAVVEQRSEHPLAKAVMARAAELGLSTPATDTFEALVGAGAQASSDGRPYLVGSPDLIDARCLALDELRGPIEDLERAGRTAIVAALDDEVVGVVGIADVVRPHARDAISELRANGISHVVMLTGDNARTAEAIAAEVGIDDVRAHLKPEDKSRLIAELASQGHVGMIGDGVNDAPALAAASVGIAMGTAGSDVALETADVALMADDLSKLTEAVRIGRRTRRIVAQNIALSLVILAVLVPGALLGVFALPVAVLAHELTELAVIINALRLARR